MAFLKIKVKQFKDNREELRAYAYDSYVLNGQQKQFSVHGFGLCRDKADANERFKKWLKVYRKAKTQKRLLPKTPTLQEFAPLYLERNEQLTGNKHQSKASLKHLIRHLGKHPLDQITRLVVLNYRDSRTTEAIKTKGKNKGKFPSPKTINHELSTLSSLIRKALELEQIKEHPFLKYGISLKRNFFLKVIQTPKPALTRQEFMALMQSTTEERSKVITLLYAVTGMRQGELINLRLTDIDLDQNRITFRAPKTGDFRTLAIPTVLKPIFEKLLTHIPLRTGWQERKPYQRVHILCNQKGEQQKTPGKDFMTQAAQRAGIKKHVTPHILRHSFCSHAANHVNIWELKELMGHKNITTTEIYVKTFKTPDVETANKITGSLGIDTNFLNSVLSN
ncbi:MAG TPA: tyrosine-type recombinase/integrase [bacterium]|nr:tyrosine-type recombinase/integrase [bacterium]